ncbi:hypothetical protein NLJ89_g7253 [Agrocybe chaxingu]|uniref:Uncharacterized protein n=1 Tax=Agrocybe chaxingu TaxID=84603 RepID=A0A9W8MV85_9AGAR|nr:hypothetical protein NLJ89_g7253 [Agrocybe chaxingu]
MMTPNDYPAHNGYSPFPTTLPPYVGAVLFETFLYGIYFNLFLICVFVLLRRNQPLHYVLLISAITMFALATADIVYTYCIVFGKLFAGVFHFLTFAKYYLYVTNNVLADTLLLYRCYIVWDFRKDIVIGPLVLLIAGTVCGYIFEGATNHLFKYAWIYLAMTLVLNLLLTGLTAGRIFWIARAAEPILGDNVLHRYNSTIAILTESGAIYSLYIILNLAFHKHKTGSASSKW